MFRKPTVFVLGAGANFELGLPLGDGLMTAVASCFRTKQGQPQNGLAEKFIRSLGNKYGQQAGNYLSAGERLVRVMPRFPSIDEAMHYLSEDAICVEVGKGAIVSSILSAEHESKLKLSEFGRPRLSRVSDTWLAYFLSMAL